MSKTLLSPRLLITSVGDARQICVVANPGARAADQVEVFAWSRDVVETLRFANLLHHIFWDQDA